MERGDQMRGLKAGAVGLLAAAALGPLAAQSLAAPATDDDRPVVRSIYARDEGSTIQLKVSYCDNTRPYVARYRQIFRIFDDEGDLFERGTSTRQSSIRCVNRGMYWPDYFPSGAYYAQIEVRNLDNGTFIRTQARPFYVS